MTAYKHLLWACVLLAACDGNPFGVEEEPVVDPDPEVPTGGINSEGSPVTTGTPSRDRSIVRREATSDDAGEIGNGYVKGITFTAEVPADPVAGTPRIPETFAVDGLAFDGGNVYQRGTNVASLGTNNANNSNRFAVYEADSTYTDDVTGTPISQFSHRAIYGVSPSGNTKFAVVRTGAYVPYGFGGFIYQRDGVVTLPVTGQAHYKGEYAALRDFNGRGGLEYATGDMEIDIDFNDFNEGSGVAGIVYNRAIFDVDGNDVTPAVLDAMNSEYDADLQQLPVLLFAVGPGALDANGEMGGTLNSYIAGDGEVEEFEEGNYYAVISGDATSGGNDEVVGVIVVTADDPRYPGVTVRETGGFLLYRN